MQMKIATSNMEEHLLICLARKLQNGLNLLNEILYFHSRYKTKYCLHFSLFKLLINVNQSSLCPYTSSETVPCCLRMTCRSRSRF